MASRFSLHGTETRQQNVRKQCNQQPETDSEKPESDPFQPRSDQEQSRNNQEKPGIDTEKSERPEDYY
jgi:hypothetical protein